MSVQDSLCNKKFFLDTLKALNKKEPFVFNNAYIIKIIINKVTIDVSALSKTNVCSNYHFLFIIIFCDCHNINNVDIEHSIKMIKSIIYCQSTKLGNKENY